MAENLKTKAVHGVFWSAIEQFSGRIIQFFISIIIARMVTPEAYGIVGLLGFFMAMSSVFIDSGFSTALIQRKDRSQEDLNTVFYINLGIATLCYLLLVIFAPLIADFFHQPLLVNVIYIYCLTLIIGAVSGVNNTLITIEVNYKLRSKISLTSSFLSGVVGIGCAYSGLGVWALVIQALSNQLLNTILSFYYVRWFPKLIFSKKSFKALFSFGSKLLMANVIAAAYTNIYPLIIGKQFNASVLGYYTRATSFPNLISSNLVGVISRVSFPILCKVQDDDEMLVRIYSKYIHISSFIIFPIFFLLSGIAKPLILVLLSEKWSACIGMLQIVCFVNVWYGLNDINCNIFKVKGRTDLALKIEVYKKIIAVGVLVISILFDNIYAICWGAVIYSLIDMCINTTYAKRFLGMGITKQILLFWPYLILSVMILLISLGISHWISNMYLSLTISIIFCPCMYLFMALKFKTVGAEEFLKIINPFIQKFRLKH